MLQQSHIHHRMTIEFFDACKRNDIHTIKKCLANVSQLSEIDCIKFGCEFCDGLFYLCEQNNIEAVRLLSIYFDRFPIDNQYCAMTPMCIACRHNHVDVVNILLHYAHKINLNKGVGEYCRTPFMVACYYNNIDVVRVLIKRNDIDFNKRDATGRTPFNYACSSKYVDIVKLFLERADTHNDIRLNSATRARVGHNYITNTYTAFVLSCLTSKLDDTAQQLNVAKMLLQRKDIDFYVKCDIRNLKTITVFYFLCYDNRYEVVKILLEYIKDNNIQFDIEQ